MRVDNVPRVMWLLNHTSARKFEIPMLKSIGFGEIFLPKIYPNDPNFRSASVDWSEDQHLTIPADDLAILNEADWYGGATRQAWDVANKYFDYVFFIVIDQRCAETSRDISKGGVVADLWSLRQRQQLLTHHAGRLLLSWGAGGARIDGNQVWFAEAYDHLHTVEKDSIATRAVYIPLGLKGAESAISEDWTGRDERILFVCPDIGFNHVYADIYKSFKKDFKGFPYAVGGSQVVALDDPNILGFLPLEEHQKNMREMRVMYYHSQEPRHIHFHPFEAIRAGMPLVFQSGGILDKMGGMKMPGRCADGRRGKTQDSSYSRRRPGPYRVHSVHAASLA